MYSYLYTTKKNGFHSGATSDCMIDPIFDISSSINDYFIENVHHRNLMIISNSSCIDLHNVLLLYLL